MFSRDTRMSEALGARPELRAILAAFHPAFARLSHPVLGRVLPRLVTVEDAARIAGVDADAMLAVMNLPGPPAHPAAPADRKSEPEPAWLRGAPVRYLDVRPALQAGEEPFAAIMAAMRQLSPGEVLTVLAPFEPAPLRRIMGERGWETHVAWDDDACRASFWRRPDAKIAAATPADLGVRLVQLAEGGARLDLRGLEPPEPLRLALAALDRGADVLPLTIVHNREPALLYPRLAERGLRWTVTPEPDYVLIRVHASA